MDLNPWWIGGGLAGLVALGVGGRWLWHLARSVQVERSRELFRLQHERLAELFLEVATKADKVRGLKWIGCEITGEAVLTREIATGQIVAFVPIVVRFEPVEGSDMEDVPAAREPRPSTAVFTFEAGHWHTAGRVVFNLTPHQAVEHFTPQYHVIEPHH